MIFLCRVAGVFFFLARVRTSDILEEVKVKLLLLCVKEEFAEVVRASVHAWGFEHVHPGRQALGHAEEIISLS